METPFSWLAFMILVWRLNFNLCYFSNIPAAIVAHLTFSHSKTDDTDDTNGVSTSWQAIFTSASEQLSSSVWPCEWHLPPSLCQGDHYSNWLPEQVFPTSSQPFLLSHRRFSLWFKYKRPACLVCFCLKKNYILNFHPCKACRSACITIHSFFVQLWLCRLILTLHSVQ